MVWKSKNRIIFVFKMDYISKEVQLIISSKLNIMQKYKTKITSKKMKEYVTLSNFFQSH